jgi:dolichol-phosphate mannosyltransferase
MISLVLPTFNEAASIEAALRRCAVALEGTGEPYELIVVDDSSPDQTGDLAEQLSNELPVRVLRRRGRNGLASAVVAGWNIAKGDVLAVMDADLQHPPEILTELLTTIRHSGADIAIASRTAEGGGSRNWSPIRQFTSWTAKHLAACVLPITLADVQDAMSGMFMLKKEVLKGIVLEPKGYKILLEVLAKGTYRNLTEVPYVFGPRDHGSSKLGTRQTIEYFMHLSDLAVTTGQFKTWLCYALVGFSGASIHLASLLFLITNLHWPLALALLVAIQVALLNNFLWNRYVTFRRVPYVGSSAAGAGLKLGLARYEAVCIPGALLNSALTAILLHFNGSLLIASSAGVILGGVWNLFFNVPAIWRSTISPNMIGQFASLPKVGNANLS